MATTGRATLVCGGTHASEIDIKATNSDPLFDITPRHIKLHVMNV